MVNYTHKILYKGKLLLEYCEDSLEYMWYNPHKEGVKEEGCFPDVKDRDRYIEFLQESGHSEILKTQPISLENV